MRDQEILPLISRSRAEEAIPLEDCSGRTYDTDEREDLIRSVLFGAEIQRDKDCDKLIELELGLDVGLDVKPRIRGTLEYHQHFHGGWFNYCHSCRVDQLLREVEKQ